MSSTAAQGKPSESKPSERIHRSNCPPTNYPTNVSLSRFLIETNPEQIQDDKVILEDNWTHKRITYGGIREAASRGAWGLRHKLGLQQGDVAAVLCPNAVGTRHNGMSKMGSQWNTGRLDGVCAFSPLGWRSYRVERADRLEEDQVQLISWQGNQSHGIRPRTGALHQNMCSKSGGGVQRPPPSSLGNAVFDKAGQSQISQDRHPLWAHR